MRAIIFLICAISLSFGGISKDFSDEFKKAQEYFKKGKLNQSISILKPLAKTNNEEEKSFACKLLANLYLAKNDLKNAAHYLKLTLKNDKNKKDTLLSLSSIYIQQKKYKSCIKILKSTNTNVSQVQKNLAICYYYDKNYPKSIRYAQRYIKSNSNDKQMYELLFNASMNAKDFKKAVYYFSKLNLEKNEDYYTKLSYMYKQANKDDEALSTLGYAYEKGLLKSKKALSYYEYLLEENKIYKRAIEVLKASKTSDDERILNLYIRAKDYKNAINLLKNAPSSKNDLLLAKLYYKLRDFKKCNDTLKPQKFAKNSKLQGEAYILKAIALYELKDLKSFEKVLEKALTNKHSNKEARKMLAQVLD